MNRLTVMLAAMGLLASASAEAQKLTVSRGGSRPVVAAPAQNFPGDARVDRLFEPLDGSRASGASVAFEPAARTAWHSHPWEQILIITAGVGRVQRWGDPVEEVRAGDVVRIPAGEKHWHGASPRAAMTHVTISEPRDGASVQWMEQVNDAQYNGEPTALRPQPPTSQPGTGRPSGPLQQKLAPGMAALTDDVLYGDVWRRPNLAPRDRSLVTIASLIATGKTAQLAGHLNRALANGLQPGEASGLLAHLAVYCGWPNAVSALDVYEQVYTSRKIDAAAIGVSSPRLSVHAGDAARAESVTKELGAVAPKFVQLTNDVVFDGLWRRSDLSLRDRSLVTIAALSAMGDDGQLDAYVRRGLESGLTRDQIAEAVTHVGFYAGWGKATKAMTVISRTFGK